MTPPPFRDSPQPPPLGKKEYSFRNLTFETEYLEVASIFMWDNFSGFPPPTPSSWQKKVFFSKLYVWNWIFKSSFNIYVGQFLTYNYNWMIKCLMLSISFNSLVIIYFWVWFISVLIAEHVTKWKAEEVTLYLHFSVKIFFFYIWNFIV